MIVYVMFIGLSGFLMFLFFYVIKLERSIEKKFGAIELGLENLNREVFEIKKREKVALDSIKEIEKIIEEVLEEKSVLEEEIKGVIEKFEREFSKLYSQVNKNKLPSFSNISKLDEEKILSLYKEGYSVEDIARELRVPAGEVEFIVKFSSISKP